MTQRTGSKIMMNTGCCLKACTTYLTKGIGKGLNLIWMEWWNYEQSIFLGLVFYNWFYYWHIFWDSAMTEQEIKDIAPDGSTHYFQREDIVRYHKIIDEVDYWFDGRLWRYSAFNQLDNIYEHLKPL